MVALSCELHPLFFIVTTWVVISGFYPARAGCIGPEPIRRMLIKK